MLVNFEKFPVAAVVLSIVLILIVWFVYTMSQRERRRHEAANRVPTEWEQATTQFPIIRDYVANEYAFGQLEAFDICIWNEPLRALKRHTRFYGREVRRAFHFYGMDGQLMGSWNEPAQYGEEYQLGGVKDRHYPEATMIVVSEKWADPRHLQDEARDIPGLTIITVNAAT